MFSITNVSLYMGINAGPILCAVVKDSPSAMYRTHIRNEFNLTFYGFVFVVVARFLLIYATFNIHCFYMVRCGAFYRVDGKGQSGGE